MSAIIASIDFSNNTPGVIRAGISLSKTHQFPLILCHVVEPASQFVGSDAAFGAIQLPIPPDMTPIQKQLDQLTQEAQKQYPHVTNQLLLGSPAQQILDLAKSTSAAYLVLGSHGRGALYHLFVGSVITEILKKSPIPVLVTPVKPHQKES